MSLITRTSRSISGIFRLGSDGKSYSDSDLAQFHATVSQGVAGGQFVVRMTNILKCAGLSINSNLDTVTIQSSGRYVLDFVVATNTSTYAGISVNHGRDGSGIAALAIAKVLTIGRTDASTVPTAFSVAAYLNAGDYVSGHIQTGVTTNETYSQFRITQMTRG